MGSRNSSLFIDSPSVTSSDAGNLRRNSAKTRFARMQRSSNAGRDGIRLETSVKSLSFEDVQFLSRQTGLTPEQVRLAHKEFHRISADGQLTKEQFGQLYKLLIKQDTDERIEAISLIIFRAFDHDRSGYIEFGEFLVGFAIACKGDLKSRLAYAFDCYDANYSTFIEKDEIKPVLGAMLQLLGMQHPDDFEIDKMAAEIMNMVDASKDGKISKQEFVEALSADAFVRGMLNPFN